MNFVTNHHDTYPAIDPTKADLSGKSVLITGASKGVGRCAAARFAAAGCSKIALAARSSVAEVEKEVKAAAKQAQRPEPLVLGLEVDVTSEASVAAAADKVAQEFGSLDVLINNAGYLENWVPVGESKPTEWWRSWEVNVKGTYLCSHYFLPLVLKSEMRTVLNLSSAGGHNTNFGASAYQTGKSAICRFTEFLDREYADQGLTAVVLHPGGVKTELAQNMPEQMHAWLIDTPELPADVFVWLAKEKRDWLAGRFISANWDVDELEARKDEILAKDTLKFKMTI